MTNRILGLVVSSFLLLSVSVPAQAHWHPYRASVFVGGTTLGWGLWGWPGYATYFPVFGNSYWPYYNYQPLYSTYGAISYSQSTGYFGVAWGQTSRYRAQYEATQYCGQKDCKPAVWVQGGCAALAQGPESGALGYSYHTDKYLARAYAMKGCQRSGQRDCVPLAWVCSY